MDSKDEEKRIAMTLARRAYLYGAFHVVFGGGVHEASAAQLFGELPAVLGFHRHVGGAVHQQEFHQQHQHDGPDPVGAERERRDPHHNAGGCGQQVRQCAEQACDAGNR